MCVSQGGQAGRQPLLLLTETGNDFSHLLLILCLMSEDGEDFLTNLLIQSQLSLKLVISSNTSQGVQQIAQEISFHSQMHINLLNINMAN